MKKAQLQLMQNAFIMIFIMIILMLGFVVVVANLRQKNQMKVLNHEELEILKKTQLLSYLPELLCANNNQIETTCYDLHKVTLFNEHISRNALYYNGLFGSSKLTLTLFDPSPSVNTQIALYELYDNPLPQFQRYQPVFLPVVVQDDVRNRAYFGILEVGGYS